jgi:hypothetical protein
MHKDYYGEGSELNAEVVEACSAMLMIGRLGEQVTTTFKIVFESFKMQKLLIQY